MSFEVPSARALDDVPCRYGESRLLVRGPQRDLGVPYFAFLGSSDTYGKFVHRPFPALLEEQVSTTCVNLGCANAGVDAFLNDAELIRVAGAARAVVVQVMGAQNLSNRFYRVHPRRNDRFLEPTALLSRVYPEVDFTEFNFNKHMLTALCALSPDRFAAIRSELREAWVGRMNLLIESLKAPVLLLWLRREQSGAEAGSGQLGSDPLMITRDMLDSLAPHCADVIDLQVQPAGITGEAAMMVHGPLQAPVAESSIGPDTHMLIADRLAEALRDHA
ncbi:DUF6473 family protein [Sedimentitalea arenosa]|uniref:DUF6473 domain-containing protein n=1 Tax=Sedimentitalea arenosa TaxID=2798803 RepID=A0A8J7J781_9RHOB|nr:DUF6473 family protein [Arenibacterium arenosum]MBJ6372695.1 hypothetical protein [Arenibacterium arenosum]